jgi:hypothetical protein
MTYYGAGVLASFGNCEKVARYDKPVDSAEIPGFNALPDRALWRGRLDQ